MKDFSVCVCVCEKDETVQWCFSLLLRSASVCECVSMSDGMVNEGHWVILNGRLTPELSVRDLNPVISHLIY